MTRVNLNILLILFSIVFLNHSCAQTSGQVDTKSYVKNTKFDKTIKGYLDFSVPIISVDSLFNNFSDYVLLDAREFEEYNVSHIPGASFIGYDNPQFSIINEIDTTKDIVLYCSIGYRSEVIAKKLKDKGLNVLNLYGSIFEWTNKGYPLKDTNNNNTKNIHGYNKSWSKWIENPDFNVSY